MDTDKVRSGRVPAKPDYRVFELMKKETTVMINATHIQAMLSSRADRVLVRLLFAALVALCLPSVAAAQTANLWIDNSGGNCTRQSTAGGYGDAAACASMQAARMTFACEAMHAELFHWLTV